MRFKNVMRNTASLIAAASVLLSSAPFTEYRVYADKVRDEGSVQWKVEVDDSITNYAPDSDIPSKKKDSMESVPVQSENPIKTEIGEAHKPVASDPADKPLVQKPSDAEIQSEITASGIEKGFSFDIYKNSYAIITKYDGNAASLVIPDTLGGKPVQEISDNGVFKEHTEITSVTFPKSLTKVGRYAFQSCYGLESVNFPDSVTDIGYHAFYDCSNLSSFTYPKSFSNVSYSYGIFGKCPKLTKIEIPEGVTAIPSGAFKGTEALVEVKLPSTLTTIGNGAFENCVALPSIDFNKNLTTIGNHAFQGCTALTSPIFNEGLTTIGEHAFESCYALENANLPDSVTTIGYHAFYDCSNLYLFTYPKSFSNVPSGGGIFGNCPKLTKIEIPEGVTTIPNNAFWNTEALVEVTFPSTLTTIGNSAFKRCVALNDPIFNEGLTTVGNYAFESCYALESANLPDSVTDIGYHAFYDCSNLSSFTYPKSFSNVPSGGGIFGNCPKLTKIEIPEGVTTIPSGAFRETEALVEVKFPSTLTTIGNSAFKNCVALPSIEFNKNLTTIGNNAFQGCKVLTDPIFNEGLATVGNYAFESCYAFESANLPDSVTDIGYQAFYDCSNLSSFTYPKSFSNVPSGGGIFGNCPKLTKIEIPEGVTTIPNGAFKETEALVEVKFPSTLTTIGSNAFKGCKALTDPIFNEGLTTIGSYAFQSCYGLESANLPDSVTDIGYHAFYDCSNLSSFTYPKSFSNVPSGGGIFGNCPKLTKIEIPEGVTSIPDYAFRDTEALIEIKLPSTLTTIGSSAFKGCKTLTDPIFNEGLTTIGIYAFQSCYALESANLPNSVTDIGYHAFYDCSNLSSFTYPKSFSNVPSGGGIFGNCPKLTKIEIPEGATAIPNGAFKETEALVEVKLPSTLTTIGNSAFENCTALSSLKIPDNVTTINNYAFYGCTSLTNVKLSKKLTNIGYDIFENCPLESVLCANNSLAAIYALDNDLPLVLVDGERTKPANSLLDYSNSNYRTNFSSISSSGSFAVVCEYKFTSSNHGRATIKIKVPVGCEFYESNMLLTSCDGYDFNENTNTLYLYTYADSGKETIVFNALSTAQPLTYATISYNDVTDVLGIINESIPAITINADQLVNKADVNVSGISSPESKVDIYINESKVKTVTTNKVGYYSDVVTIPNPVDDTKYTIKAQAQNQADKTAVVTVEYSASNPILTGMKMIYNGRTYDLMNTKNINVTFILEAFHGVTPFKFTLDFEHPESVHSAFVTSTRNGITKYLEAKYDESSKKFVAEGYFDENDHDYVPGKLSIAFQKDRNTNYEFDKVYERITEEIAKGMPEGYLDNVKCTVTEEEETITIDLNKNPELAQYISIGSKEYSGAALGAAVQSYTVQSIEKKVKKYIFDIDGEGEYSLEEYGYDNFRVIVKSLSKSGDVDWFGYLTAGDDIYSYLFDTEDEKYHANLDFSKPGTWAMVIDDTVNNDILQTYIEYKDLTGLAKPFIDSNAFSIVGKTCGYVSDQFDIHDDYEKLKFNIQNSTMFTDAEKEEAIKQAQALGTARHVFSTCMLVAKVATVFAGPMKLPLSLGLGILEKAADALFEMQAADILNGNFRSNVNWAVDPSGYVYEAVTSNRLENVKATAYWIPYDDEDVNFWNNVPNGKPENNPKAQLWNAEEYSQPNPIYTDLSGMYAWDTPEGWWIVKYEKEGYETAYSRWLPVPPPQLEVNIAMVSTADPAVEEIVKTEEAVSVKFTQYMDITTLKGITVYDSKGEKIEYTLEYSKDETAADGTVYAKEAIIKVADLEAVAKVVVPDTVKSYAKKAVKAYTERFGETDVMLGDLNDDKKININDVKIALRGALNNSTLTDEQFTAADVNKDTKVNISDVKIILKAALNGGVIAA